MSHFYLSLLTGTHINISRSTRHHCSICLRIGAFVLFIVFLWTGRNRWRLNYFRRWLNHVTEPGSSSCCFVPFLQHIFKVSLFELVYLPRQLATNFVFKSNREFLESNFLQSAEFVWALTDQIVFTDTVFIFNNKFDSFLAVAVKHWQFEKLVPNGRFACISFDLCLPSPTGPLEFDVGVHPAKSLSVMSYFGIQNGKREPAA